MSESSSSSVQLSVTSRFRLLDRPLAIPGKCVVCGAVDRPVIDTGWDIDYYGVVYFCKDCLTEVSSVIGMVDKKLLLEAEMNSARQFREYLVTHKLRVMSDEQYRYWVDRVSGLYASVVDDNSSGSNADVAEAAFAESTADKDIRGAAEQESYTIVDEGPISISDGSDNGIFNFPA